MAAASVTLTTFGQSSTLSSTAVGPGTLTFWWSQSSFSSTPGITFLLNGVSQGSTAFLSQWQQRTFYLPSGTNYLAWRCDRGSAFPSLTGYLDEVAFVPGPVQPLLTAPLVNRVGPAGTNITFSVGAEGTPSLFYQWQFAGNNLLGATNSSLALENVQMSHVGLYTVTVSNAYGSTNSTAFLTVTSSAPVILSSPSPQEMVRGGTVTFRVEARGSDPLAYQWQFEGVDLPGATNATLTLGQVQPAQVGNYRVAVTNALGGVLSSSATLTLVPTVIVGWGRVFTSSPNPPLGLTNVLAISGGDNYSVALRTDGNVYPWGWNAFSRLAVPAGLSNVTIIAAGGFHGSTLLTNGSVVNWGDSFFDAAAVVPAGLSNVVDIAAGFKFNLALQRDNTVVAWGDNNLGPLNLPSPLDRVVEIGAGQYHGLAIRQDGMVVAWGFNNSGQSTVPPAATNAVAVAGGSSHSLALQRDGSVIAWGSGSGTSVPVQLTNVVAIAAGWQHSLALRADGTVVAWGENTSGQIDVPVWLTNVVAISAGSAHSLALLNDGTPYVTRQPWTQTIELGDPVTFSLTALGQAPLQYQWQFNGTPIPGATNTMLMLTNSSLGEAGDYSCVVSNHIGSVRSLAVRLTVQRSGPQIAQAGFGLSGGSNFELRLTGLSGHGNILLYASSNLVHWESILTNGPAIGELLIVDPLTNQWPQRFFRVVEE